MLQVPAKLTFGKELKLKLAGSHPWMRLGHKVQTDAKLWPAWQAEGSCLQQPTLRCLNLPPPMDYRTRCIAPG